MKYTYTFFAIIILAFLAVPAITFAKSTPVPVHLTISDAKVEARIIKVGTTKEGNLDVPNNYTEVGWYKYGPVPGKIGSVVLDGHVDNGGATPGPFKNLKKLTPGDEISVMMSDGSILHYAVSALDVYKTSKFPGNKIFGETDKKYLKLITCHGTFVSKMDTYDERLVVTAVLIEKLV